ncbi:Uncharacterized membrane protein [Streptococcus gallolyticus]|uniref:Uncharacterized membrane protein n=1 Tax=Streptococcus gallolyticus TaxID=315405 RepID=A0A1H7VE25_9STRE|nr:SdpI family protein [Streptococcus gallolyticus]SEF21923.1 Uncharacterized membrane protein [Streptococcus gallolyticus]SEM07314.1 Uncharacterized membrane protein [Streptococcus gallolyticus]
MKINKKSLVKTSLVILLPVFIGILLWNQLPSQVATHFDISGNADGYNSKIFAIFAFPILFLLFQLIMLVSLEKDSVKATTPARMVKIYAWLIPFLSLIVQVSIYANALGVIKSSPALVTAFLGIIFIFIGNYLPKTQRNYTIGIRLPWTLSDDRNWYKTHRFASKIWVLGGLLLLFDSFFQLALPCVLGGVIGVMVIVPVLYSFVLSRHSGK